jgi:DNA-binding NtrC family response regulator
MTLADGQEVLVVDADEKVQKGLFTLLAGANLVPTCLGDVERARELIKEKFFACAVVDLDTPAPGGGIELIKYMRRAAPAARVFVMTARKVYEAAVEALRAGAADIVVKSPDQVEHLKKRIVEAAGEARERAADSNLMTDVLGLHEDLLKRLMETSRRSSELEERLGGGAHSAEADGESPVLVIEPPEDAWLGEELRKSLAAVGGYNLHVSTSGGEGIDVASRTRFHIALVCDTLPDLPGSMVVSALKSHSPETITILYSKPGRTRPGKAEVLEGSRVIQFVPELGEASQMLERIGELRQAFVAKSRERRYLAAFREQNYELLRRYAELKQRIARAT